MLNIPHLYIKKKEKFAIFENANPLYIYAYILKCCSILFWSWQSLFQYIAEYSISIRVFMFSDHVQNLFLGYQQQFPSWTEK